MEKIRFDVVGLYHWDVRDRWKEYAAEAVGRQLVLQPQPENVKDPYAVRAREGSLHVGYVAVPGRRNLMEFLQDTFTLDDLNTVRRAQGMKGDGSALLRKWVQRGYCTFDPSTQQYTKSPQFLAKHQKPAA
jgi:hypothetical protein